MKASVRITWKNDFGVIETLELPDLFFKDRIEVVSDYQLRLRVRAPEGAVEKLIEK